MTKLEIIILLLPIVFMIHEYEEIIMFENWLGKNRDELKRRFPKFEQFLACRGHFSYSTATFALGTAHEFLLISFMSICAVWSGMHQLWFASLAGYFVHLAVHLVQWIVYGKYTPAIITTVLTLPYCIYAFCLFSETAILSPSQMFVWAVVGIVLTAVSLFSAFFLMGRFQRWQDKYRATK